MSGPRRYHSHPNMAEPCVVDEPPEPLWRRLAAVAINLGALLLVFLSILGIVAVLAVR